MAVYFLILQSFFVVCLQSNNCFSLDQNAKRFSILWGYDVQMRSKVEGLLYFCEKKKEQEYWTHGSTLRNDSFSLVKDTRYWFIKSMNSWKLNFPIKITIAKFYLLRNLEEYAPLTSKRLKEFLPKEWPQILCQLFKIISYKKNNNRATPSSSRILVGLKLYVLASIFAISPNLQQKPQKSYVVTWHNLSAKHSKTETTSFPDI